MGYITKYIYLFGLSNNNLKLKPWQKWSCFFFGIDDCTDFFAHNLMAQEEEMKTRQNFLQELIFTVVFIWRGSKLGTGPAFQPTIDFTTGGLSIGVWGSFDGCRIYGIWPLRFLQFSVRPDVRGYWLLFIGFLIYSISRNTTGSHALELSAGIWIRRTWTFSANYIINEAGGVGSYGGDMYFQAGYAFEHVENLFLGAGNGWYTSDGECWLLCNVGLGTGNNDKNNR